jgi:alanyl-tRNA synthetase
MQSAEVARRCLDWFAEPGHAALPGAGLLTNGPLSRYLASGVDPLQSNGGPVRQVVTVQRCLRPDDMRIVGRTGHHGTFFQMVTAVSAGSDATAELARTAWLLTTEAAAANGLGIPGDRLRVVVATDEVAAMWTSEVGIDASQIVRRELATRADVRDLTDATALCDIVLNRGLEDEPPTDPSDIRSLTLWSLHGSVDGNATAVGLGVERLAMAVQLVATFSDTDQVRPVLDRIARLTGTPYDGTEPGSVSGVRLRVAADHVRTALMLADAGVTPTDGALGRVLQRLVRRTGHAVRLLGHDEPILAELLPIAGDLMAPAYPSVAEQYERIEAVLLGVEAQLRAATPRPHVTAARPDAAAVVEPAGLERLGELCDACSPTESLAYQTLQATACVVAIVDGDRRIEIAGQGATVDVILDRTPFFAERCGQAADHGTLRGDGVVVAVTNARWAVVDLVVHRVRVEQGELRVGDDLVAEVDADRRVSSCQAHSASHVLQAALRDELGEGAVRLFSSDEPGRLVLELDGTLPWSDDIAGVVEDIANHVLRSDLPVDAHTMGRAEAQAAGALHAHRSGGSDTDIVRVVEIDGAWSRELCDGMHVLHTSQIGLITLADSGVTDGGRLRIEALCGLDGLRRLTRDRDLVRSLSANTGVTRQQLMALIDQMESTERGSGETRWPADLVPPVGLEPTLDPF